MLQLGNFLLALDEFPLLLVLVLILDADFFEFGEPLEALFFELGELGAVVGKQVLVLLRIAGIEGHEFAEIRLTHSLTINNDNF